MTYTKKELEQLAAYETILESTAEFLDKYMKSITKISDKARAIAYIFDYYEEILLCDSALAVYFNTIAFIFMWDDLNMPSTRNCFNNLLCFILDVAYNRKLRIDLEVLEEVMIFIETFRSEEKSCDCLEKEEVAKIVNQWNEINDLQKIYTIYADKFDKEDLYWNEGYGLCVATILYLFRDLDKDYKKFQDRNFEFILFTITLRLNQIGFKLHTEFVDDIIERCEKMKKFTF